jgi:hypothetical protein
VRHPAENLARAEAERLALAHPGETFVVLSAQQEAVDSGVVEPAWRFGTPATLHDGTFAYRSALRWTGRLFDLGAYAHGPQAAAAAGRMVEHMRAWVDAGCPSPVLHVLPVRALDGDGKQFELEGDKRLAVCIQHELDHLDGKVFVDYLSRLKRERIRTRLQKQQKKTA